MLDAVPAVGTRVKISKESLASYAKYYDPHDLGYSSWRGKVLGASTYASSTVVNVRWDDGRRQTWLLSGLDLIDA